jgi:hypothetical protein
VDKNATEEWNAVKDRATEADGLQTWKQPRGMVHTGREGLSRAFWNEEEEEAVMQM